MQMLGVCMRVQLGRDQPETKVTPRRRAKHTAVASLYTMPPSDSSSIAHRTQGDSTVKQCRTRRSFQCKHSLLVTC